jgi:hypothetical protein
VNGPEQQIHSGSAIRRGSIATLKRSVVAGCIAAIISGCASSPDNDILSPYTEPGRSNYLDCPGITERLTKAADRERQLAQLMTPSEAADGVLVNAIAYQGEYNTVRANLRSLRAAAEAKKCPPQ